MNLDWGKVKILHEYSESVNDLNIKNELNIYTEIKPEEYYLRAKNIMRQKDISLFDILEIITNSKRAIDCKCCNILKMLGFDKKTFSKNSKLKDKFKGEGNAKIIFVSNLTGLNSILIEELRATRNILEHDYKSATVEDARRCLAIAELLLIALDWKLKIGTFDFLYHYSV